MPLSPLTPVSRLDELDPVVDATRRAEALQRVRALSRLMDDAIRLPGTSVGVGLDAVIGLVPGLGDVAGGVISAYVLMTAARLGVPRAVLARMLLNLGTDTLVGAVPLLGDLFDVGFKANVRNVRLIEQSLELPSATRRSSALVVAGVVVAALAIAAVGVTVAVLVVRAIWGLVGG